MDIPAPRAPGIPPLRQELRIERGAALVNGAPSWTLFDPVRHIFYQLGKIEYQIFAHWAQGKWPALSGALQDEGVDGEDIDAEIGRVVEFSLANNLTLTPMGDSAATFTQDQNRQRKAWWKWMVDNYLFFRIPLFRPAAFLERTLPRIAPIWSPASLWFFIGLALLGLFLVSRQWDSFMASFAYFFSWQGVLAYGLGLSFVKIIHELGHAYTATRYGVRVASMGVSFLVMFPVLYTDTTGAWRLRSRKQRLAIDCAGVSAELMVAAISTLLWVVLPEGPLRSVFFVLATSSWVLSLVLNLNPFMRFDGYYVLSDLLDVPNLQPRSFALGKWRMREMLFGLGEPAPEDVPARLRRGMIVYAWITWLYRLVLFFGIALLVYYMFFKLLGIILFVVEIGVFIARPVWLEMRQWNDRRAQILQSRRGKWVLGSLIALTILAALPLDRSVSAPAILAPEISAPIVAGDPARVEKILVKNGDFVKSGTALFELSAPELEEGKRQNNVRIAEIKEKLARGASDAEDLNNRGILERELATLSAAASGVERRLSRLILRSPHDGMVVDLPDDIQAGRWLNGSETLALVISPDRYDVQAYVTESDVWRVADNAAARFVPDDPSQSALGVSLAERSTAALQTLDQPMLASSNGGAIAVNEDEGKNLRPRAALYRLRFTENNKGKRRPDLIQPITGKAIIAADPESFFGNLFGWAARIFRQEGSIR
jgi:putative peptide zinc metalloprotease protein